MTDSPSPIVVVTGDATSMPAADYLAWLERQRAAESQSQPKTADPNHEEG